MTETKARWFRTYSADRKLRKAVGASTLEELISEAKRKFGVDSADEVSIVLEEDGTCVDEEEYFQHGLHSSSVLMLLKSDETWTECGEAEMDDVDADEPDSAVSDDDENVRLRQLCSRLHRDLKHILLLSTADCQVLVDADRDVLCRLLHRSGHEVELIQTACQRYIDEHDEFHEAQSLLQLIQKDSRNTTAEDSATNDNDDLESKRKRRK